MKSNRFTMAAGLALMALVACSRPDPRVSPPVPGPAPSAAPKVAFPPIDTEGCEHLTLGPAAPATATAAAVPAAPAIATDHKRYDVSLASGTYVKFQSAAATEYVFFTSPAATLTITDATGNAVPLKSSSAKSEACGEIKGRYSAVLGVGVYYLRITAGAVKVSIVVEDANASPEGE